ncbi:MAG: roadblock/LC7 domain-containing protein [Candidatus Obscuribacterales bacterium]|nr:roadblock/LC7 domain-containing protein [Candidatus Obscuribacterales bacterium]
MSKPRLQLRQLPIEAESELKQLLDQVGALNGVIGSLVVGHDGWVIANTMPPDTDPELLAQKALDIYKCTSAAVTKLGHMHVHQLVGRTSHGYVVIADFGGGLLVIISNASETSALIPLMRSITGLTGQ